MCSLYLFSEIRLGGLSLQKTYPNALVLTIAALAAILATKNQRTAQWRSKINHILLYLLATGLVVLLWSFFVLNTGKPQQAPTTLDCLAKSGQGDLLVNTCALQLQKTETTYTRIHVTTDETAERWIREGCKVAQPQLRESKRLNTCGCDESSTGAESGWQYISGRVTSLQLVKGGLATRDCTPQQHTVDCIYMPYLLITYTVTCAIAAL